MLIKMSEIRQSTFDAECRIMTDMLEDDFIRPDFSMDHYEAVSHKISYHSMTIINKSWPRFTEILIVFSLAVGQIYFSNALSIKLVFQKLQDTLLIVWP